MNILITGGNSFLSNCIYPFFNKKYTVFAPSHSKLDVTNLDQLKEYIQKYNINIVVHTAVKGGRHYQDMTDRDFVTNITMLDNLIKLQSLYKQLFIFSSGATFNLKTNINKEKEFDRVNRDNIPDDLYGRSKYFNDVEAQRYDKIVNLRLFNLFSKIGMKDSFIHVALDKYLYLQPIKIWANKQFDFFYDKDLIKVLDFLITNPPSKYTEINLCYKKKFFLEEVAEFINFLDIQKVKIYIDNDSDLNYTGNSDRLYELGLKFVGIKKAIKEVYSHKINN